LSAAKAVSVSPKPAAKNERVSSLLAAVSNSQETLWRTLDAACRHQQERLERAERQDALLPLVFRLDDEVREKKQKRAEVTSSAEQGRRGGQRSTHPTWFDSTGGLALGWRFKYFIAAATRP
jgi:hypothetical protein